MTGDQIIVTDPEDILIVTLVVSEMHSPYNSAVFNGHGKLLKVVCPCVQKSIMCYGLARKLHFSWHGVPGGKLFC